MQDIEHTHAIEVRNKKKILKQLDNIGLNYGSIYGDYDSIALSIKEKYASEGTV